MPAVDALEASGRIDAQDPEWHREQLSKKDASFEEEKHPRDSDGKFGSGGGGTAASSGGGKRPKADPKYEFGDDLEKDGFKAIQTLDLGWTTIYEHPKTGERYEVKESQRWLGPDKVRRLK